MTSAKTGLSLVALSLTLLGCQTPHWPVEGAIRSPFGLRMNGVSPDVHRGVDIAAQTGTPVRPLLRGRVRFAGTMSGFGSVIWVDHSDNLLSVYAHLSEIRVKQGDQVDKHQIMGLTGMSGNAQGPHLHLEVWRWGREVDPVAFLGGPPT
ncbi:MAG: M23 family metallopeptidase [Longimicrobiales bacterium]